MLCNGAACTTVPVTALLWPGCGFVSSSGWGAWGSVSLGGGLVRPVVGSRTISDSLFTTSSLCYNVLILKVAALKKKEERARGAQKSTKKNKKSTQKKKRKKNSFWLFWFC